MSACPTTSTASTSASPPPNGGRGTVPTLGVGGLALALTIAFTTPTLAQVIPTGSPAADILLSQAITEHRVFLTCSALDPQLHSQILTNWQRDTAAAVAILTSNKVPPEAITAFSKAADPAALMPSEDTPWADVKALCDTHPDWQDTYFQLNLTILDLKLPAAFP
jgi:hypothetical protein